MERSYAKGRQAEIPTTRDDPAIGRWGSVDPLFFKYPAYSPYNYVLNNPVKFNDPDGKIVWLRNQIADYQKERIYNLYSTSESFRNTYNQLDDRTDVVVLVIHPLLKIQVG